MPGPGLALFAADPEGAGGGGPRRLPPRPAELIAGEDVGLGGEAGRAGTEIAVPAIAGDVGFCTDWTGSNTPPLKGLRTLSNVEVCVFKLHLRVLLIFLYISSKKSYIFF